MVSGFTYPEASPARQSMIFENLGFRPRRWRLAEEAAKLDPNQEKALAEEGFAW
jgi:hypothetical protein